MIGIARLGMERECPFRIQVHKELYICELVQGCYSPPRPTRPATRAPPLPFPSAIFLFFVFVFYKNIFLFSKFTEIYSGRPVAGRPGSGRPAAGFCAKFFAKIFVRRSLGAGCSAAEWPAPGRPAAGQRGARRSAELSQEIEEADELMTANDVTTRFDGAVVLAEFD